MKNIEPLEWTRDPAYSDIILRAAGIEYTIHDVDDPEPGKEWCVQDMFQGWVAGPGSLEECKAWVERMRKSQ